MDLHFIRRWRRYKYKCQMLLIKKNENKSEKEPTDNRDQDVCVFYTFLSVPPAWGKPVNWFHWVHRNHVHREMTEFVFFRIVYFRIYCSIRSSRIMSTDKLTLRRIQWIIFSNRAPSVEQFPRKLRFSGCAERWRLVFHSKYRNCRARELTLCSSHAGTIHPMNIPL